MVVTTSGKDRIRDLIGSDNPKFVLGSGTTTETSADTLMAGSIGATLGTGSSTLFTNQMQFEYLLSATTSNGNNMSEFGFFVSNGSTMLTRTTFTALEKIASEQWEIITILDIL